MGFDMFGMFRVAETWVRWLSHEFDSAFLLWFFYSFAFCSHFVGWSERECVCVCIGCSKPCLIMFLCTFNVPKVYVYYIQLKQHKFSIEWTGRYFVRAQMYEVSESKKSAPHFPPCSSFAFFLPLFCPPLYSCSFEFQSAFFDSFEFLSILFSMVSLCTSTEHFRCELVVVFFFLRCCIKLVFVNVVEYLWFCVALIIPNRH